MALEKVASYRPTFRETVTLLRFGAIPTRNSPTYLVIHVAVSTVAEISSARPLPRLA